MYQRNAEFIRRLSEAGVEYVLVGGVAAAAYGNERVTYDLDIVVPFTVENMSRLLTALQGVRPRHLTRPDLGEIPNDPEHFSRYRNLYLLTDIGRLDVLGELPPLGAYAEAAATAVEGQVLGRPCKVLGIDALITIKESLGREQDRMDLRHLKKVRDRLRAQ